MDMDSKITFLQELPSFRKIQLCLYAKKREFIPPNPLAQGDLDVSSDWFL